MTNSARKNLDPETIQETIVISSTVQEIEVPVKKIVRIFLEHWRRKELSFLLPKQRMQS